MEEPMLSRLSRLDNILKHLEDMRSVNQSPKSSCYASANSSGTLTSDGSYFSPKGGCRPIEEVMLEVESKGTLIDRLVHAEDRILKLCLQFEDHDQFEKEQTPSSSSSSSNKKKGLKQLVKSCVVGGSRNKKKKQQQHKNVV